METQLTTYRFLLQPNAAQTKQLEGFAHARRFVWNWALARRKEAYALDKTTLNAYGQSLALTQFKQTPEGCWLRNASGQLLQQALRDLDAAYQRFFKKQGGLPKFRSIKRDLLRFRMAAHVVLGRGFVVVPKIGRIKVKQHRPVDGKTKSATFKRDATGKWYVSFVTEQSVPPIVPVAVRTSVGIDLGLNEFAVTSGGEHIGNPRFYRKSAKKLARAQRALSRTQRGSKNRAKARLVVAKVHLKVVNQRSDFLHKLTTKLVAEYDLISVENLSVKGLARTKLAKSVLDAGWSTFRRLLTYKTQRAGKHLSVINRWFPSSKLCSSCGVVKESLTLSERTWGCSCGAVHNRDENAAHNINVEGLRLHLLA